MRTRRKHGVEASTVRDLTAGAGLVVEDRGLHELEGVREERQLFAVTA